MWEKRRDTAGKTGFSPFPQLRTSHSDKGHWREREVNERVLGHVKSDMVVRQCVSQGK